MDVNLSVLCGQDSLTKGEFYEKKDITIYNICFFDSFSYHSQSLFDQIDSAVS